MKRNIYILLGVVLLVGIALAQNAGDGIAAVFKQENRCLQRRDHVRVFWRLLFL